MNHNPRMVITSHNKWNVRLGTLLLWAAASASVVFWVLRLSGQAGAPTAPAIAPAPVAIDTKAVARLLGAVPSVAPSVVPTVAATNRFVLVGVLSGRRSGGGAALIAVDGKPAKTFRVGATVDQGLILQALGPRQAQLGAGMGEPATVTLDMPLKPGA